MKYLIIPILLLCVCVQVNATVGKEIVIDISKAEEKEITLSSLVSSIEYIPLELTKECPINESFCMYVTSQYILAVGVFEHMYVFNRENGRFVKEVSSRGGGPEQYIFTFPYGSYDYDRQLVYVDCIQKWKCIDVLNATCVEEIVKPSTRYQKENIYQGMITNPYFCEEGYYVGFANNTTGNVKEKILFFDHTGKVIKSFFSHVPKKIETSDVVSYQGLFYHFENKMHILPGTYADTVYLVHKSALSPHIVFKGLQSEKEVKLETIDLVGQPYTYEQENEEIAILMLQETSRYVFFKLRKLSTYSCGYYDKQTKKTIRTPFKPDEQAGLKENINGLLSFNFRHSLAENTLIGWMNADVLTEQSEQGKLKPLTDKAKKLIEQTQFDDNPIIVVAVLK